MNARILILLAMLTTANMFPNTELLTKVSIENTSKPTRTIDKPLQQPDDKNVKNIITKFTYGRRIVLAGAVALLFQTPKIGIPCIALGFLTMYHQKK